MKIRQYTAPTMQEAILKIKVDLGPDAIILHTRKFKRGGFFGFFAQDMVEVLAAIDPPDARPAAAEAARAVSERVLERNGNGSGHGPATSSGSGKLPAPSDIELGPLAPPGAPRPSAPSPDEPFLPVLPAALTEPRPAATTHIAEAPQPTPAPASAPVSAVASEPGTPLAGEVEDLKSTVSDLKSMLMTVLGQLEGAPRPAVQFPPLLQRVYDRLVACDVEPSIARGLVVYLQKEKPHLETFEELVDALATPISGLFEVAGPISLEPGEQKVVALVGPTGVGKTTTIAKLAATFAVTKQKSVALLTIDTYRVAAVEQLKTYGDIIGLPVEVVTTPQGVREALKAHASKDLVLIDTAGRSPQNRMQLKEIRGFLEFQPKRETHLVLSSTTRLVDLKQIVKNFSTTGVDRLIFTKTDESELVGGIISIAHETGLPVSYVTTGQSVPDDIMVAHRTDLTRMLLDELKA